MVETPKSPGDYGTDIYSYINELDPTFKDDVSTEQFLEKLQNEEYANKIYAYLANSDKTFVEDVSLDDFIGNVKKKEEPVVTESVSDAGSSEQRIAARQPEQESYAARVRGLTGQQLAPTPYETPAEIAKRDSATTAIETREARIAARERELRQEEARRITADLPPVTIPEGSVTSAVSQLQETYGPYGIKFEEDKVPFAMTRAGSKVVKAMAPSGVDGKPVEIRLELDEDGNIKQTEAAKLEKLIRENATYVGETDRTFVEKSLQVQELRPVPRIDTSGVSTVKMASGEVDGKFVAYPTLFPKDPEGTTSTNPEDWIELNFGVKAFQEAEKRGEVFYFDTDEQARAFADGAWKGVVPMDLAFQQKAQELGRDYDADMAFLDQLDERRDEYKFLEDLSPGSRYEKEIPASYQKYFIDGNLVRDDINALRDEKEAELSRLESAFDADNVLLRFKEDRDVALGKRYQELSEESAAINRDAKAEQNRLQVESLNLYGVRLEDLIDYEPKTEAELAGMIDLYTRYNKTASQRQAAALGYEKAQTYYDKQHDKGITQEYVDGWEEVSVAWSNGLKRGRAMSRLLLMQYGYYDAIGDEGAEERAMREVAEIMDSQDPRRGRVVSRANMTGTTDSYLAALANNPGMYTAAITAESLAQLAPIWARVLPAAAVAGGAIGGAVGSAPGSALGFLGGAITGAGIGVFNIGMPISELALEMGNATLEVGERMGYDWADPNSALKALNDQELWDKAAERGYKRGIPIALTGALSNFVIGKVAGRAASTASFGERIGRGAATGLVVEPLTEALGERIAIGATGEYTGSTANFREIMAEAIGAVGMGVSMGAAFGSLGYAKQKVTGSNFDLAVALMDPRRLARENVSGERVVSWANRMEKLGKINAEQAEQIRKNVGLRRQANELLGKRVDSRPGGDSQVTGRIMELLEAKQELERSGANVFGEKIRAITEEIAIIAESGKVERPGGAAVNLSDVRGRIQNRRAGAYKFNGKSVSRQDFLAKIQEATPRQLRKARVYNDQEAALELVNRRNAIQERGTTEVPVGKRAGFGTEVDEEVREATQEDLQAEEEGSLDPDRKGVILETIAEKLNDGVELTEVEQSFLEDNKKDIEANQKRLATLDQESADVEVRGEQEVEGRIPLKRLKRLAANAKKAMAKNFEGADIIIHNDKASYQQAAQENGLTGEQSAGFLAKDDKTVHIFAPLASSTTIAHETFHVVLRNSVDKADVKALMGEFVTTLRKVLSQEGAEKLAAKLDEFQKLYEAGEMNEEYVAEFFGELAAAYPTLDKKGKSVIARFLERLSKLLGLDLTLPSDLTKRDQQVLSLLERLAGQVSRGETITARETGELAEMARSTSRKQTEDNLGAAEQRVDDFSDEQIQAMADEGVIFHFSEVDITKVLPEKLKRFVLGYGFYFTNYALSDSTYRNFGDRFTMVNAEDFNLLDGDTAITEEQAKALRDAAKTELQEAEEYGDELGFEESQVLMSLADTKAGEAWANHLAYALNDERRIVSELTDEQRQVPTRIVQEMLGFDGVVYGRPMTMGKTGAITVVWNFPKIDRAIIEPGQEPTRAAEQRVLTNEDGSPKTFYHGTDATFEEFTPTEGVRTILAAQIPVTTSAFFFTEDEAVAREYGKNVIPVNLSFSKLVNENIPEAVQIIKEVFPDGIEYSNGVIDYDDYTFEKNWIGKVLDSEEGIDWMLLDVPEFMDALKAAGFDGTLVYEGDEETSMAAFDNSNIQRLDREPRAAEQRVDVEEVRMRSRAGSRISKGLATYNVKGEKQVEEIENLTRDYVREEAPAAYIKNANILAKYPLVRGVREFGDITTVEEADELYDIYTQQTLDNLRWMMETYPDEFSEISTLWYDGANKIANEMATRFGVTPEQAAGILAALSPQKDWYQNVRLAELLLEAFEDNPVMTREMIVYQKKKTAEVIKEKKKDLKKARTAKGTSKARAKVEKFNKDKARLLNDIEVANALLDAITALEGTRMMDADPSMVGYFVRLHAETTKPISYQVISPDGEMVGPAKKDDGSTAKWAWGSYNEIGKGVSVMLNGSQENITASLGQQHKVRNFYNNIIDPMSTEGDVTMDTHAIAVSLLKPLSTKSDEVNHNFGGKGASSSGAKGIKGTYYANQEAYQMLAEEMGLLPRQVQSVTWEAVRGLFTDKFKGNKENVKAINQIWENYADGKITIDEARAQVLERAGGVNPPVWAESVQRESGEGVREGRERGAGREGGRAAEQRVDVETEGPTIVYRSGAVDSKAESRYRMSGGRSTGHFGTGAYFFGDRESAEKYDDRDVTAVDISDYNLAPATYSLHDALEWANRRPSSLELRNQQRNENKPHTITMEEVRLVEAANRIERLRGGMPISYRNKDRWSELYNIMFDKYYKQMMPASEAKRIAAEATRLYNEEGNIDSASTSIMKALGYEGVNAVGTPLDNSTYGTVIYDVRTEPKAAEQRVDVEEVEDKYGDFAPGTRKMIRIGGGRIEIAGNKTFDRSGILELFVPEESRRQGIGTALVKAAIEEADGKLVGMASKDAAVTINYNLGMRYYKEDGTEATLEETKKQRAENSYESIFMATPEARQAGRRGEAAEQRVVDPGVVDVLERYEFKPNKSLKNAELAPELNRNLQRFGYGVKQYGTRMNDFRVVSLDTGRAVDPKEIIAAGVEERAARLEEDRRMVEMERQRELEERIIEIYNADERPFTGKDFEARAPEQRVAAAAMAEPGTIADLVARGRELGLRDASIRSVLLKRFGKDNADAIDTALTEYFDMFRAIPEAFGNVEGGIEVGREIYDDVRRQLDEFARPKKPGRMTTRERTDRIEELRAKFPEQKNLSDTELLRKHPRQAVAPTIAEVRAEALNLLRNNRSFNEQTKEVQEQLLVAFDKTLQTSANKRVNTLMAQIRNNIRQRRKGESSAKAVRNELRKVINEMLPAGKYTKAEAKAIATLVSNVTEKNMLVQIQKVTDLLEKKAKADIKAELRDIKKLDSRIRSERKYAEREARKVQNSLRKLINEVIPRADYGKADIAKLTNLVASVNESNYEDNAEEVLKIVEKKRGEIRDSVIRDIAKLVANSAKTSRTPSGKVRPRSLDAPGQAYFREANRILRAIRNKDQSLIMDIASNLANNPMVDVATQKMLNGEKLTMREQQLLDQKSALDMFSGIQDKSLEEVEAILEDLKVDVGFSRANLKATRAARAARMAELREGATAEVQDNWAGFATNEDGSAKTRNQLEADKTQKKTIGDALRENGLRAKYDALVEWAKEGKRLTPAAIARNAANITHVGALTGIMGEYFRENLYKRLGKMEERHLQGIFETKGKLDEMAATIEGIENYKDITDLIFTSNPDGLTVNTKATGRRKLSNDEMMRIYALSKNPVQRAKLEAMGFTDEVMNEIVDTVDDRLLEFVDKTVDYLANDYYEGINDVYSKVNDINLGYIENYFPTRTQVKGDLSVKSKEETLSSTFFGPNAQVATALKERTDQKGEILMTQDLGFHGELGNHFNTMERFKAYAEGVQEMNAILSSDYTVALSGRLNADSMLNMLIAHGVTPDMFMSEMSFKGIDTLISKYTGASLAFKLMQIPKQATSFIGGFQQYRYGEKPNPVKDLIMFSFDYAVLLPQILLEGISLGMYKGPIASIAKDSATFRARLESNFSGDVYGLTAGVSGRPRKVSAKDYTLYRRAGATLRKASGSATAFGDILGVLGYLPAYNRNRMRGMSQEEAIDKFNEYNETQQSRRPGERTPLQIRQNGLTRAFMAFTSSQILYLNNTLRHANNINKSIRKGEMVKAEDSRGLIFNAVMSSVLFTLASNIFVLLFGSDEEKERAFYDTLGSPVKNLFAIPIWGAAIEEFYNLYVGNEYPTDVAINPLGKVVRDVKKVATGGDVSTAIKEVGELALGTNFDPGLSLINIAQGEPIEPELYNLIGVPKSARPESD